MAAKTRGSVPVRDAAARRHLQELDAQSAGVEAKIARLLEPVREELTRLVLERDRLRYRERAGKLFVRWDDRGPQFALGDDAELAQLHPFVRRRRGRRNWDVIF